MPLLQYFKLEFKTDFKRQINGRKSGIFIHKNAKFCDLPPPSGRRLNYNAAKHLSWKCFKNSSSYWKEINWDILTLQNVYSTRKIFIWTVEKFFFHDSNLFREEFWIYLRTYVCSKSFIEFVFNIISAWKRLEHEKKISWK